MLWCHHYQVDWTRDLNSETCTFWNHTLYACLHYDFSRLYLLPMYPCWHTQVNIPDWFTALPPLKHSSVLTHSRSWLSQSSSSSAINLILITCMFVSVTYVSEVLICGWKLIGTKFRLEKVCWTKRGMILFVLKWLIFLSYLVWNIRNTKLPILPTLCITGKLDNASKGEWWPGD